MHAMEKKKMATRSFERVHCGPIALVVLLVTGVLMVFVIAALRKDVSPYMPFISEAGAKPPEAGIFSIILYFSAVIGMILIVIRFMIIEECHQGLNRVITILNRLSLPVGVISMMGMVVVAAYPMVTVLDAHNTGAFSLFIGLIIYAIIQTVISYLLHPSHNSTMVFGLRIAIVILGIVSFLIMAFVSPKAFAQWRSSNHTHWTGSKTPEDEGFTNLVVCASAEWVMMLCFLSFFLTFISEFKNASIHVGIQLMVEHFEDDTSKRRYTGSL